MTLNHSQSAMVVTDATIPILATLAVSLLRFRGKITHGLWLTYWWGALIGALWEIPFGLAGDSFLQMKFHNPLGFGVHILHCFWDSLIFLVGLWGVHLWNHNRWCGLKQLGLLTVWGILQAFCCELIFNNRYWQYQTDNRFNQVVFTINGVGYTTWPFLTWVVAPIPYLSGVMAIVDAYGPLRHTNNPEDQAFLTEEGRSTHLLTATMGLESGSEGELSTSESSVAEL